MAASTPLPPSCTARSPDSLSDHASSIQDADLQALRDLGVSDAEIMDVVHAAAARCFFSKTLDGLGVLADPRFRELEPGLRDALTVGRPIAAE